jgi:hypothetical protein
MAIEEVFGVYKNSNQTEEMVRWRKVVRENKEKFNHSWLAALAGIMRSIPLTPKINQRTRPLINNNSNIFYYADSVLGHFWPFFWPFFRQLFGPFFGNF